ncbi:TPA: lipase chaperone [Enterococcus faecium]|uniref:lipase chaperone n=1 Tax=Enterococcus faecium TaxID=1352 RepID=UPI00093929A8|nr:lipase chaperone [Enterococcus faecium]
MGLAIFLSIVGLLGFIVGLIMLIMNLIKKKPKKVGLIITCVSVILFIAGVAVSPSTSTTSSTSASKTDKPTSEVANSSSTESSDSEDVTFDSEIKEDSTPKEVNPADYNTGITYDALARTPDEHIGNKVTLSGEIVQVIEGDDASQYRMAVDQDYDKMVLIEVPTDQLSSRILENDLITIYGVSQGTVDYESTIGGTITVPAITVDKFEVTGQA